MLTDQDLMDQLMTEAVDAAEDRLSTLSQAVADLATHHDAGADVKSDTMRSALARVKMEAHSLKSIAASFDMTALKALCHRFEDYIFDLKTLEGGTMANIRFFVDRMAETLDAFVQGRDVDVSALMRRLPAKGASAGFDVSDVSVQDVEVMLVMEPSTVTKIVTRELVECGYRIINVASTIDALSLIPSMRPDAVVVSRVMPELSGIDLAAALKAMPTTRAMPVALITSNKNNDRDLKDLPSDVPVLHKGTRFGDDVADVFIKLGLL
ncbi:Hpt domain-containing protein [Yunchengibacter salinarum]|uniref:Hpt domain-containing protein n=1 Tax=Yunchengibacter salinarum TaxID=3133399 RepID=UPI0035B6822B